MTIGTVPPHPNNYIVSAALLGPDLDYHPSVRIEWADGVITSIQPLEHSKRDLPARQKQVVAGPGLIDAHVHLALSGSADVVSDLQSNALSSLTEQITERAKTYPAMGVTTVRDLGSPEGIVPSMLQGGRLAAANMPRVIVAQAISSPSGHGNFIAQHAETLQDYKRVINGLSPETTPVIKLFASGGVITENTSPTGTQMDVELLREVTEFSHSMGFQIAAHAHSRGSILACLEAEVDTIEHFSYLDEDLLEIVKHSSSTLVSTFVATHRFALHPKKSTAEPSALKKILSHHDVERHGLSCASKIPDWIIAGSDSGTILNTHSAAIIEQAELMEKTGFSRREALKSLTVRSAEALKVPTGQISVGYAADIVVWGSDPLASLDALRDARKVILRGQTLT